MINLVYKKKSFFIGILLLILCICIFYVNILFTRNYSGGKYFLSQWTASRALISSGEDPYSDSVLFEIQQNAYGRPAMAGEYEFRFNYPFFSLFFFLPFGLIKNYAIARAAWMLFLELIVVLIYSLSLNLANWTPKLRIKLLLFIFTATFYHTLRAIVDGNLMIVITILFLGMLIALRDRNDQLGGILLAGLLLEFHYTIVLIFLVLFLIIKKKRYLVLYYFIGSTILLSGFSLLLQPDWILKYSHQLWLSIQGLVPANFIGYLTTIWGDVGKRIGVVSAVIICILLLFEIVRSNTKGMAYFFWLIFLAVVTLQWCGLPSDAGNFIFLVPGFIYSLKFIEERWTKKGEGIIFTICLTLFILLWVIFFATRFSRISYQETAIYYLIFPVVEFALLFWSKWWIIRKSEFELNS